MREWRQSEYAQYGRKSRSCPTFLRRRVHRLTKSYQIKSRGWISRKGSEVRFSHSMRRLTRMLYRVRILRLCNIDLIEKSEADFCPDSTSTLVAHCSHTAQDSIVHLMRRPEPRPEPSHVARAEKVLMQNAHRLNCKCANDLAAIPRSR